MSKRVVELKPVPIMVGISADEKVTITGGILALLMQRAFGAGFDAAQDGAAKDSPEYDAAQDAQWKRTEEAVAKHLDGRYAP